MDTNFNRYFQLRNLAWEFLIESEVKTYPLNLEQVIEINGWEAVSYQKLGIKSNKVSEVIFTDKYTIILFNEQTQRQELRQHIAHEIGHIVLKHYNLDETEICEAEARMFARRILMPTTLIHNLKLFRIEQIIEKCDITYDEAKWRLERYFKTLKQCEKFDMHPLESKLKEQLGL